MRYKMVISYDGSFFHGFQRQTKYISVQEVLEEKLSEILKLDITVYGSGRTDAGVHAKGQVIHFDSQQYVPPLNLMKILNKKFFKFNSKLQIYFISKMKIFKISNEYPRISLKCSLKTSKECLRISPISVFILCLLFWVYFLQA